MCVLTVLALQTSLASRRPLWTAVFASALGSAPWGRRDAALSVVSLVGVWLVARPSPTAGFSLPGVLAGLAFGACGGLLNVMLGDARMRTASPSLLSAWQMGAAVVFSVPSLLQLGSAALGAAACSQMLFLGLGGVGLLMVATSWMRTTGLQSANSSAVATLLYTEIAWAFFYNVLFLASKPDASQYGGAALIIGGAIVYALAPSAAESTYEVASVTEETRPVRSSRCSVREASNRPLNAEDEDVRGALRSAEDADDDEWL